MMDAPDSISAIARVLKNFGKLLVMEFKVLVIHNYT
jgi:ubiquinone/menaquinone biosynthesis C-methylase UbiE